MAGCLCLVLLPLHAAATDGNELLGIGAIQKGTAGAGIASPQDATWAWLNPASIVDLERRVDIAVDMLSPKRSARVRGPLIVPNFRLPEDDLFLTLANQTAGDLSDESPIYAPQFGLILPAKHATWGFGVFSVQGNDVLYPRPRTQPGRQGFGDRRAQLAVLKMPIAYGRRFDNGWSVGVSAFAVYQRLRTDSLTLSLFNTDGDFGWDESWGIGFKLSLYKKWDKWSFGAAYTTRQWTQEFDDYDDLLRHSLDQPQQIQVGLAYRPTEKLELVLDYKFIDWSAISVMGNNAIDGGLSWDDSHIIKFGATYDLTKKWTLRAGVSYGEAPVPADSAFTNVLFPAIIETHVTAGFSWQFAKHQAVHFAYMYGFENSVKDTGSGDLFSRGGEGTEVTMEQHGFTLQYSYSF